MNSGELEIRTRYPVLAWRGMLDLLLCYAVIGAAWTVCRLVSFWFYPLAALLIANRLLAISLIGHEALHGNLCRSSAWNEFLGKYLGCFPCWISFKKYRRLHLLHHRALGAKLFDPDLHLYASYPEGGAVFFWRITKLLLTGRLVVSFFQYYTELPELFSRSRNPRGGLVALSQESDLPALLAFWFVILTVVFLTGVERDFFLFVFVPAILVMQPYVIFMGALQHAPFNTGWPAKELSRTVTGPRGLLWLLLPLDICFHAEHHLTPQIPHYWLSRYSKRLQGEEVRLWRETYSQAVRKILR